MFSRWLVSTLYIVAAIALELLCRRYGSEPGVVVRADFGISAGVVIVISLVSQLFNRFNGQRTDFGTKMAVEGMRGDLTKIAGNLTEMIVGVGWHLAEMIGSVKRFLQRIFGKLYDMLARLVNRVIRILDRVFGPIIDFLEKVKFHLKKFYDKVIKPILDTIEIVRDFLRLMELFGIDWAKKLDTKLAELEQYIVAPYEFIIGKINDVMNVINRIVTLDGLLQRVTLLQSLLRDASGVNNMLWHGVHLPMTADQENRYRSGRDSKLVIVAANEARDYIVGRGGPDRARIDEAAADVRIKLARLGVI